MSLRKWSKLFFKTLLVGAIGAVIAGLILQLFNGGIQFKSTVDILIYPSILLGYGALVSVYSQMGFFAYLTLNYMGTGIFRRRTWQYIQVVLATLALFELVFFRTFVGGQSSLQSDLILGIAILLVAIVVAYFKVKSTNASAWIPTIFFMVAVTIVEIIGVLGIGVQNATIFIIIPLLVCNAYQILTLHKVTQDEKKS
ncbi:MULTISPECIES: KinB-signaling pathway activation protein [Paenibacillus]|uniref:KinB signaling pathway activation protein n=1 Tax=Paenibacillus campinasensis TaxID=66347 RepID=A0A268EHJ5_9BACL|nr:MULTISPECIES: KinB-signaling pathway activation protein [Paenibacillus]MUG68271.1 KinB signaling pathway activation protein [Paenibacillus campinasensis]PAD72569.1 KinB signaling pathway activation protein [Paenibacillus campinasensis]PAK49177.1 KinB signaling pathway activation protein [Paenibacillus sp. 7541]